MAKKGVWVVLAMAVTGIVLWLQGREVEAAPPGEDEAPPEIVELYGRVTDKRTGEPIRFVAVKIPPTMPAYYTETDADGHYYFSNLEPGLISVSFTKIDYAGTIRRPILIFGKNRLDVEIEAFD